MGTNTITNNEHVLPLERVDKAAVPVVNCGSGR